MTIKFNDEIVFVCKNHKNRLVKKFVDEFTEQYNHLTQKYPETYTFIELNETPDNIDLAIGYIPGWIGSMIYSMNYRTIELMEDFVNALNSHHYLSSIVLTRTLMENAANIYYYFNRLKEPTEKLIKLYQPKRNDNNIKKDIDEINNQVGKALVIIYDFNTKTYVGKYPRTNDERWIKKHGYEISNGERITRLINKLRREEFNKSSPDYWYHILCNYAHPNAESNRLALFDVEPMPDDMTKYTLSRYGKNLHVLENLLNNVICVPILGSLKTIIASLGGLKLLPLNFFTKLDKVWNK